MALIGRLLFSLFFLFIAKNIFAGELMLGLYAFPDKHFIDLISNSELRYLIVYGTDGVKNENYLKDFLDYANNKNIKIIFSLKDCYKTSKWYPKISWCDTSNEVELAKCILRKFGDHPSIIGFYLADDASDTIGKRNLGTLKQHAKNVKEITKKPVFVHDYPLPRGKMWDEFMEIADYFIIGIYPIPEENPERVYEVIKDITAQYSKPVIALIQAHGKYQYPFYKRNKISGRPPTFEEIKIMSSFGISAGAQGIIYYSLFDIEKLPDGKERLNFLKDLSKELN